FLAELVGAQLAIKVTGAAPHALTRLRELGDARRRTSVRDRVFDQMLHTLDLNLVHLGTGLVLLLGAQAISDGTFTVGDFALFVVFLGGWTWYRDEISRMITGLRRTEVSYGRMRALVPGEPAGALVTPAPVYLRGEVPELPPPPSARERFERLEV